MKRKAIFALLIVIILFNFIFSNFAFADTDEVDEDQVTYSEEALSNLEEGTVTLGDTDYEVSVSTSSAAGATNLVVSLATGIVSPILGLLATIANSGGLYYIDSDYSASNIGWFNICSLVFGEYLMFNANILQTNESLNSEIEATSISNIIDTLKNIALGVYQIVRYAAIILMGVMLFYTCGRLFIENATTTANSSASYEKLAVLKKTRDAWIVGFIFLLALPFLITLFNYFYDMFMDILYSARTSLEAAGYAGFESVLFEEAVEGTANYSGFVAFIYAIELVLFAVIDVLFFVKYFKRLLIILALTVFAPVISVLDIYAKLRNKPGIIVEWIKRYLGYMLLQPMHALIYLVFLFMGSNIAISSPLIGIILLYALDLSEKVFNIMFDVGKTKLGSLFVK